MNLSEVTYNFTDAVVKELRNEGIEMSATVKIIADNIEQVLKDNLVRMYEVFRLEPETYVFPPDLYRALEEHLLTPEEYVVPPDPHALDWPERHGRTIMDDLTDCFAAVYGKPIGTIYHDERTQAPLGVVDKVNDDGTVSVRLGGFIPLQPEHESPFERALREVPTESAGTIKVYDAKYVKITLAGVPLELDDIESGEFIDYKYGSPVVGTRPEVPAIAHLPEETPFERALRGEE